MILNKKTLEYLAELSRIKIDERKEEKLLTDLREILNYFEELKELNTENIEPMTGGTNLENVFREDDQGQDYAEGRERADAELRGKLINQFPEKEGDLLKIPPVFE